MKNLWKGASALALSGAVVATSIAGCVEPEASFFVISAKAPECEVYTNDSIDLFAGVLDIRYTCGYDAVLLLGNQLVRRGDEAKLQIETSRITVTHVDVELLDALGDPLGIPGVTGALTNTATGFVDAARSGTPGEGLARTLLVDGFTAQALGSLLRDGDAGNDIRLVTARVVVHGRTLGGDDIETRPWDFPIEVCDGCLCRCNPDDKTVEECTLFKDVSFNCSFLEPTDCAVNRGCTPL